jgi:hypothetical protein
MSDLRRLRPSEADVLIAGAQDLIEALSSLHNVREELIVPHLRQDGKDVHKEDYDVDGLGMTTVEDRALLNGISAQQQEALEAQIGHRGYLKLGQSARNRLKSAIASELAKRR